MLVASVQTIPTITDDPLLNTLIKGRERIEKGWCQGHFHKTETNSYCMSGAVAGTDGTNVGAENYLRQAIRRLTNELHDVPSWNDEHDRTHEEVLRAFDKAIELRRGWVAWQAEKPLALSA